MSRNRFQVGIGITSILMIFVVLCLTTFGVLAYETALNDKKMSEKRTKSLENTYESEAKVEKLIMEVDDILFEAKKQAATSDEYVDKVNESINNFANENANIAEITNSEGIITIVADIDDVRAYKVQLEISNYFSLNNYKIKMYSIINTSGWQGDEFEEFENF